MVDFIFVIIKLFRYLLWLRRYKRKSVEVGVFRRECVNLSADFGGKGASPTNYCWYQNSRVIALSCGIKMFAVRYLVLSQSTRVTDGQTDRRTERITTPKTALAYARAVNTSAASTIAASASYVTALVSNLLCLSVSCFSLYFINF